MVKRFIIVIVTLAVLAQPVAAIGTGTAAQMENDVTITVAVQNTDGDGVSGVEVTAAWDSGETTRTTASNGKTFVDVPADAEVEIDVAHDDYVRNHPYVIDGASEETVEVTAYRKASAGVTVSDSDGDAVEDAVVRFWKNGQVAAQGRTDGTGAVYSSTIERGEYTIVAVKDGYHRQRAEVMVQGDVTRELEIEKGTVTIDFTVRDNNFDSAEPVENAEVAVEGTGTVQTNSDGENGLRVPVNTDVTVTVNKDGYEQRSTDVSIEEEPIQKQFTISRTPALEVNDLSEKIVAGQSIGIEVVDEYGEPVEGATVYVDGSSAGETDASGEFSTGVDGEGDHELYVESNGVESDTYSFEAISASDPEADDVGTDTDGDSQLPDGVPEELAGMPGFGPVVALAGVLIGVALLARRS